jgi:hypothetical protein
MKELKDRLSNLIENNKIEEAIKILKEESEKRGGQMDHVIISLSSRYKRFKERSLMGLEARDQEFTKIVSDSLELVKALEDPAKILKSENISAELKQEVAYSRAAAPSSAQSNKNKYMQMGIGGLAVIGLIALIGIFMGEDDPSTSDPNEAYDNTYMESDMSGGGDAGYAAYDISGSWRQITQSFGPENDCPDCTINVAQDGSVINVSSNTGWYASLEFSSQYGLFEGMLNWGAIIPNDPDQSVQMYLDENDNLVILTMLQGVEYSMTYAD